MPESNQTDSPHKPFAGRAALYARMQQQILDPGDRYALLFTGHDGVGKTRLLQHFTTVFQDTLLGIFLAPAVLSLTGEDAWLAKLIEATDHLLEEHGFSLSRIPVRGEDEVLPLADWLRDVYLPEVLHVIRPHRRIVWLIDDAEYLLEEMPATHSHYLSELLHMHQQLAIVLTLHTRHENRIGELVPLVNPAHTGRIDLLSEEESTALLQMYLPDAALNWHEIFRLTGGHPRLLERYGSALLEQSGSPAGYQLSAATAAVYAACEPEFRAAWRERSRDERLVLTALATLLYIAPQEPVNARRIQWWLAESDDPLDLTAINAVLRGLDYLDIASTQPDKGIRFVGGLLEEWMIEHARDEHTPAARERIPRRLLLAAGLLLALILLALVLLPLPVLSPSQPLPTVTLSG